jgi:hypothetical protein
MYLALWIVYNIKAKVNEFLFLGMYRRAFKFKREVEMGK